MLTRIHVAGSYWQDDSDRPSSLGELVSEAKDFQGPAALARLRERLSDFVSGLDFGPAPLVVAVPPGPGRDAHPVPALADAVASRLGVTAAKVLTRETSTARLRDTPIERRRVVVESAGYSVRGDVTGRSVVLVDDVVLTGTTLGYLAEILIDAGAADVSAVVVCRTRLASGPRTTG